jgi:Na+-transporting NADH:ubiquinone oxidoreductase subunit NqrF
MANYLALCPNPECGQKISWENNQETRNLMLQTGSALLNSHIAHDTFVCSSCGAEGCNHPHCEEHWGKKFKKQ